MGTTKLGIGVGRTAYSSPILLSSLLRTETGVSGMSQGGWGGEEEKDWVGPPENEGFLKRE